jgi:hypothetical protein
VKVITKIPTSHSTTQCWAAAHPSLVHTPAFHLKGEVDFSVC